MKKYILLAKNLALTSTAKDTYLLFAGNIGSAFWGFLFILIVARALSLADFGVFSAAYNLVIILISLVDAGVSAGAVNFVSESLSRGDSKKADEYIKASIIARSVAVVVVSLLLILFAPFISKNLMATNNRDIAVLSAVLLIFIFPNGVFPYIFQAKKEFLNSVIVDNLNFIFRLAAAYLFIYLGFFKLEQAFWSFAAGFVITLLFSIPLLGIRFLSAKPTKKEYKSLLGFSGWIGVNRVLTGISGRIDVQMLAALTGAVSTGIYSIPQRLASLIAVFAGSFSSVLAPRMASFSDKKIQKQYLAKATLATIPIILGIIFMIIVAKPFISILFGEKYLPGVPIFRALSVSYIPFMLSVPAVTAIIYSMKRTVYIGIFSFFQLAAVFVLNLIFIPQYEGLGPTLTLIIINSILAVYSWAIVIRYYWLNKEK